MVNKLKKLKYIRNEITYNNGNTVHQLENLYSLKNIS